MNSAKNKHYRFLESCEKEFEVENEDDARFLEALQWALNELNPERKRNNQRNLRKRGTVRKTMPPRLRLAAVNGKVLP
jgi:hypothetical protein